MTQRTGFGSVIQEKRETFLQLEIYTQTRENCVTWQPEEFAAANEIKVNSTVAIVLSELDSIFTLKEEEITAQMAFLRGK